MFERVAWHRWLLTTGGLLQRCLQLGNASFGSLGIDESSTSNPNKLTQGTNGMALRNTKLLQSLPEDLGHWSLQSLQHNDRNPQKAGKQSNPSYLLAELELLSWRTGPLNHSTRKNVAARCEQHCLSFYEAPATASDRQYMPYL